MKPVEQIQSLISPIIESQGAYFVEVILRGERGNTVLEVFADTDEGVTTEKCAEISRAIAPVLDLHEILSRGYTLTVSSPGLERPLRLLRQYKQNIGRKIKVKYRGEGELKTAEGHLIATTDEGVTITETKQGEMNFKLESIIEAKIVLPW